MNEHLFDGVPHDDRGRHYPFLTRHIHAAEPIETAVAPALVRGAIGRSHVVDMDVLACRLAEIDDGYLVSVRAEVVAARIRKIADAIDSEALALRELHQRLPEFQNCEAEFLKRAVPEVGQLGVVHDARRGVRVIDRVLGVLLHRLRSVVSNAHGSPSIGATDVPASAVCDPIVGDASDAAVYPSATASDAAPQSKDAS
ncbi:hypothetical protein ACFV3I_12985 [Microbacterium sp. NPDC059771]|uniref:hypothetical protein n=1 Tax=Microbacterium sp. NPDC059771 TaxID=3346941 RepID=UPI0036693C0A